MYIFLRLRRTTYVPCTKLRIVIKQSRFRGSKIKLKRERAAKHKNSNFFT